MDKAHSLRYRWPNGLPFRQTVSHSHRSISYLEERNCVLQRVWSKGPVLTTMSASVQNLPDAEFVHMHPVKHLIMNHNAKCQKVSSAAPKHNDHGVIRTDAKLSCCTERAVRPEEMAL